MALVYKRSTPKDARAYERTRGMEPNPGVSHMTVVQNPGRTRGRGRKVTDNPFQWIEGRGQRHRHVSPAYQSMKAASGWRKRNPKRPAQLYPVDERGTVVSRPINEKLLENSTRRTEEMAYNIGALRRAMRSNPSGRRSAIKEERTAGGVKVSSRAPAKNRRRKSRRTSRKVAPNKRRASRRGRKMTLNRRSTRRRRSRRRVTSNKRRRSRRTSRRRASRRRVTPNKRRASRRRRSRRTSRNPKYVVANRRRSRRSSRRRVTPNKRRRSSRRRRSRRTSRTGLLGNKRAAKGRRRTRRTSKGKIIGYVGKTAVRSTGHSTIDQYLLKGKAPPVVRVARTYMAHRAGPASINVYSARPKGRGGISKRKTSAGRYRKRRWYGKQGYKSSKSSRTRRGSRGVVVHARGVAVRLAANRRRRTSRRRASRRTSRNVVANRRRRSRRSSRRRVTPNKRRRSRRTSRRRLTRNMLATGGVRWKGRGRGSRGKASGEIVQVVELGPKSRKAKGKRGRISGYPVYIPGHVNERAYVRSYIFGGAALDAHTKAKRSGYSEKKYKRRRVTPNRSRRTSMRKNRRRSRRRGSRRRTTRRNPKYIVANRRRSRKSSKGRRRRLRRNQFFGADLMKDVLTPVLGGTAGFVAARVLSNSLANIEGLRNILDKDKPAADAANTKIVANLLGIAATLGLATKVKMVRDNQGALITGMGLALTDRLLSKLTGPAQEYLSGFGEYVNQPLGEYVNQPLGAYVNDSMGEYVNQPLGETLYAAAGMGMYAEGVDPANQAGVDSLMDVMEAAAGGPFEAAAGMGTMYATAGMGTMYATAGLGRRGLADYLEQGEEDATLKNWYASQQPGWVSTQTPTDVARVVTRTRPQDASVPESLVTPEGKGYAGGLFARNLFGGMF